MTLVDITRYHVIKICKKYCQRPGPWRHQPIWGPCLVLSQRLKGGLRWFKHQTWGAQYSSHELTPIRGQIAAPCFNDNRFQDVPRPLQRFYMSRFGFKHRTKSPFGILNSAELHKGDVCIESIYETIYITRKVPKWGGVGRKDQIPGIQFLVVMLLCLICLLPKPSDFLAMLSTVLTHPRRFKNAKKWYSLNYHQINWFRISFFDSKFPMASLTSPRNWSRSVSSPRRWKIWREDRKTPFQIWISWDFLGKIYIYKT